MEHLQKIILAKPKAERCQKYIVYTISDNYIKHEIIKTYQN